MTDSRLLVLVGRLRFASWIACVALGVLYVGLLSFFGAQAVVDHEYAYLLVYSMVVCVVLNIFLQVAKARLAVKVRRNKASGPDV